MDAPSAPILALLIVVGTAAGWINTVAGGGSLFAVPVLMWTGLPADVANGTSRVAIVAQCVVGTHGFHKAGKLPRSALRWALPPILLGAGLGAYAATVIPNSVLKPVVIVTMIGMASTLLFSPSTFAPPEGAEPLDPGRRPAALLALFATGLYGGFLQAGVGLILLAVLSGLLRYDLVRANALKLATILAYSVAALGIFAGRGKVHWAPGCTLAVGNMLGAQLAVRFAIHRGQHAIKRVVFATVVITCVALLWR